MAWANFGMALAWHGMAWANFGMAWHGMGSFFAWLGMAWQLSKAGIVGYLFC